MQGLHIAKKREREVEEKKKGKQEDHDSTHCKT